MTEYLSKKIKVLSVIAMIAVLLVHTLYIESKEWPWLYGFQLIVSRLCRFASPFFFMISGYLFFYKLDEIKQIKTKLKKRCRSLLIPYLFWCVLFIGVIFLTSFAITPDKDYLLLLREHKYFEFFKYVFFTPAAFHLWFLRDLMIIVLLTPISFFCFKRFPVTYLIITYLVCSFSLLPTINLGWYFFNLGAYFSATRQEPFSKIPNILGPICLTISILAILTMYYLRIPENYLIYKIPLITVYILGIWKTFDYLSKYILTTKILYVAEYSFIIYCAHIPLLIFIKKAIYPMLINSQIGCLIGFILTPVIYVALIICIANSTKRISPRFYKIITGKR